MPSPITFTEPENRFLQENFREIYENDQVRSLEGPLILSILTKVEAWPEAPTFTEQENRRLQVFLETSHERYGAYPVPSTWYNTLGQPLVQDELTTSIEKKVQAAQ